MDKNTKIPKDVEKRLIECRSRVLLSRMDKFCRGEIVYIPRHNEFGFLIGPMTFSENQRMKWGGKDNNARYLVVTETAEGDLRVRYPIEKDIRIQNSNYFGEEGQGLIKDLHLYCRDQCVFECSSDCVLYKYKQFMQKHDLVDDDK